ncbi:hypothetical protein QBC39DRAFT_48353 [Podospora conica]|nr:hypothetical protein QBC39DRAFT_48353 [Schizothecium conicum]
MLICRWYRILSGPVRQDRRAPDGHTGPRLIGARSCVTSRAGGSWAERRGQDSCTWHRRRTGSCLSYRRGDGAVRVWSPTGVRLSSALLQAARMRMAWAERVVILGLARAPQPVRVAWIEKQQSPRFSVAPRPIEAIFSRAWPAGNSVGVVQGARKDASAMCRPAAGISRLHMFPLTTDGLSWPGRPRHQRFSTSCKLELLPLFLCSRRPHRSVPLDQTASGLRVRRRDKSKKPDHVHRRGCHPLPSRTPPGTGAFAARELYSPVTGRKGWGVEAGALCCCPRSLQRMSHSPDRFPCHPRRLPPRP